VLFNRPDRNITGLAWLKSGACRAAGFRPGFCPLGVKPRPRLPGSYVSFHQLRTLGLPRGPEITRLCEVVHTSPKAPMNGSLWGYSIPEVGCHACGRNLSCCDHVGDGAAHGLVNLDVAQGQGRCGGNANAGFEQFTAAALARWRPRGG
jgi:hypothetical protein